MGYDINNAMFRFPDENKLDQSIDMLLAHSKNKNKFRKAPFLTSVGGTDRSDYTNKGIKRSRFAQKVFCESTFKNSAAAGSNFTHCKFYNCEIVNANFQECTFIHCNIQNNTINNPITHSNFNRSLFSNGFNILDLYFQHSIFRQTAFIDGTMQNITFYSSTLEDTIFSNIIMDTIRFSDLNIDFSVFNNVHMNDVVLPFSQICFAFGLLNYLMETDDKVYITSVKNSNGYISKEEFLSLLPYFETYYLGTNDYFPLANIYLSEGKFEDAKNAVLNGILLATNDCDFRQIKYLSKLIYTYSVFDFHQRKQIYDYINANISFQDMNPSLLYNYNTYKNEISSFLLNNNRSGIATSEIDILTNIFPDEANKIGILLSTLENIIDQCKSDCGEHKIVFRHNSAEEIIIIIQDIYQALKTAIPMIYSILIGVFILDEKRGNYLTNKLHRKNAAELKQIEVEMARIELEREKMALEKEKADFATWQLEQDNKKNQIREEILRRNIVDNNISISSVSPITYGDIPPNAEKNICQYSHFTNY